MEKMIINEVEFIQVAKDLCEDNNIKLDISISLNPNAYILKEKAEELIGYIQTHKHATHEVTIGSNEAPEDSFIHFWSNDSEYTLYYDTFQCTEMFI